MSINKLLYIINPQIPNGKIKDKLTIPSKKTEEGKLAHISVHTGTSMIKLPLIRSATLVCSN